MLIYPDSKDLIDLVDHRTAIDFDDLQQKLAAGGHKIVFSLATIIEIAGPLPRQNARTNVMSFCNQIERLPHRFVNEGRIAILELQEAMAAISENREFRKDAITSFFDRFDLSIPVAVGRQHASCFATASPKRSSTFGPKTPVSSADMRSTVSALSSGSKLTVS